MDKNPDQLGFGLCSAGREKLSTAAHARSSEAPLRHPQVIHRCGSVEGLSAKAGDVVGLAQRDLERRSDDED
jgi:hypothetical protein